MQGHCTLQGPLLGPTRHPFLPGQFPFSNTLSTTWAVLWRHQDLQSAASSGGSNNGLDERLHLFLFVSKKLDTAAEGALKSPMEPFLCACATPPSTLLRAQGHLLLKMAAAALASTLTFWAGGRRRAPPCLLSPGGLLRRKSHIALLST